MKIGIFDSGLGGLIVTKAIRKAMPEYDYVYLGDTERVPYGTRSPETVLRFTREGVKHLFEKENCGFVLIACNTASAHAMPALREELSHKILGVLRPAAEEAANYKKVGILATAGTVLSNSFPGEIKKLNKNTKVFQNSAPMFVPLAEAGENREAEPFIKKYLAPLKSKNLDALVLGCTHYPIFKKEIKKVMGAKTKIISQDEIVPKKLRNYFERHKDIEKKLSKKGTVKILVTDKTATIEKLAKKWLGNIKINLIKL